VRTKGPQTAGWLPPVATGALLGLCAAKLLLHLSTSVRHYGYFRDELYYFDMARHLDWGYSRVSRTRTVSEWPRKIRQSTFAAARSSI